MRCSQDQVFRNKGSGTVSKDLAAGEIDAPNGAPGDAECIQYVTRPNCGASMLELLSKSTNPIKLIGMKLSLVKLFRWTGRIISNGCNRRANEYQNCKRKRPHNEPLSAGQPAVNFTCKIVATLLEIVILIKAGGSWRQQNRVSRLRVGHRSFDRCGHRGANLGFNI